jgi:hypothetical protein
MGVTVCTRFRVRELKRPIGFCNDYFDTFEPLSDVARAASLMDAYDFGPLHIGGAAVSLALRRGFSDQVLVSADAPRHVRAGSTVPIRLEVRPRGGDGGSHKLTVKVPIPRGMSPGSRTLVLQGNGFGSSQDDLALALFEALTGGDESNREHQPHSARQLAAAVADIHRKLGIEARFRHRDPRVVAQSRDVRYDGKVRVRLRVDRARR